MTSSSSSIRSQPSVPRNSNYTQSSPPSYSSSYSPTGGTIKSSPFNFSSLSNSGSSSGSTTPFLSSGLNQPSFTSHSSSSGLSSGYPGSSSSSFRSSSFDSRTLQGRTEHYNPSTSGITPPWVTSPSISQHYSSSHTRTNSNAGFSPTPLQPLDTSFLRGPSMATTPLPPSSLGMSSFSHQPLSLSGRANYVSPFSSGSHGIVPYGNQERTVWTPSSLSSERSSSLPLTLGSVSGNFSFSQYHLTNSSTSDTQFRNSVLRKLEETTKILYQMRASPERPFPTWQTIGMTPFAIQINPQMTLFVDPLNLSGVFQRVNSALVQETRASQEGHSASIGRAIAIVSSTDTHSITKYVGIFLKNTLLTIERLNANPRHLHLTEKSLSEAWETEAIPAIHRSIDRAYGTNLGTDYNPNNDGRVQQTLQNFFLDPLWLVPVGPLVKGLNLTLRGATVTIKEIGSAMKTARVALESPGAMKPAFVNAGRSGLTQEVRIGKTASSYDLQRIEKRTIQESKISETPSQGPKIINSIEQKTPGNLQRQIELGKAPKGVERADKGRGDFEKDHVHFNDGSALNYDGTWKHGQRDLTREEIGWLKENGWNLPRGKL